MNTEAVLFALIRNVICGESISEEVKTACASPLLEDVYTLAARHDLAHLVGQAVSKLELPESETLTKCKMAAMAAFSRYIRLEHVYQQVCQALEDAQIPFLPLKGSVLRVYYPEPWMRTSCDVDVLVKEAQLDAAANILKETLGYRFAGKTQHDLTFLSPSGVHIELHFDLVENGRANAAATVLRKVWKDASCKEGYSFWYEMSDAFFYFYHIAHMAKHFEISGCGIRPILDLWLLDNLVKGNQNDRDTLLQSVGLLQFATASRKLSRVWFDGEAKDHFSERLQNFVLHGGVYGSMDNWVVLQQESKGSKWAYVLSRIFTPYKVLKKRYPILENHRWLAPVMQVRRWFTLLRLDVRSRLKRELAINRSIEGTDAGDTGVLLDTLGINTPK